MATRKYIIPMFLSLLLGSFIFLFFFNPIGTGDIWWHLSTGKWIVEHGQVPHTDIFPFDSENSLWSCHNEWLGSVILYLIVKVSSFLGLKFFKAFFFVFVMGILSYRSYKYLPFSLLIIFIILETLGLANRGDLKPDMFNSLFIPIFLIYLLDYEENGQCKRLWALPILSFIWFNIHIGSFIYGMSLVLIFFLSACIRYFYARVTGNAVDKISLKKRVKDLGLIALACLLSFLVNPYGLEGFLYPFKIFLVPDFIGLYKFDSINFEMQPAWYIFSSFSYFYYFVLFASSLLVLFFNKRDNLTLIMILLFSLVVFLCVQRNSTFFCLVCGYIIIVGAQGARFKDFWQGLRFTKTLDALIYIGVGSFLLVHIFHFWFQKDYYNGKMVNQRSLIISPLHEAPIDLLLRNKITGPVFNSDVLGGEMIWLGYPDLRPFRDGRNNSIERHNNALAIFFDPQGVWPQAESVYHFKIVILDAFNELELPLLQYLDTQPEWELIAINGSYVTYVKRGEFNLPKELDDFEGSVKSPTVSTDDLQSLDELARGTYPPKSKEFFLPSVENVDLYLSFISLYRLGYMEAAVEDLIKTSKVSNDPDLRNSAILMLPYLH